MSEKLNPTPYIDLADLLEDERIKIIGKAAAKGGIIAVYVENKQKKIKRYIRKITNRHPSVRHIATHPGPRPDVVLLQFGPLARH